MQLDDAFMIETSDARLAAVYHAPQKNHYSLKLGCLILVGGPQYRVGAHRQYVALARGLAKRGVGVLRFDYQGMGDSTGAMQAMEDRGNDIEAASQALRDRLGSDAKIFPWGLCEGASAIFMHNHRIVNMAGAIIANPWVGDARIEAQVRWRHYYLGRLNLKYMMHRARSRPFLGGNFLKNAKGFLRGVEYFNEEVYSPALTNLPDDMAALLSCNRPVLYIASSDDRERETFDYALASEPRWKQAKKKSTLIRKDLPGADHTFSTPGAKQQVEKATFQFMDEQTRPIGALAPATRTVNDAA